MGIILLVVIILIVVYVKKHKKKNKVESSTGKEKELDSVSLWILNDGIQKEYTPRGLTLEPALRFFLEEQIRNSSTKGHVSAEKLNEYVIMFIRGSSYYKINDYTCRKYLIACHSLRKILDDEFAKSMKKNTIQFLNDVKENNPEWYNIILRGIETSNLFGCMRAEKELFKKLIFGQDDPVKYYITAVDIYYAEKLIDIIEESEINSKR